MTSGAVEPGSGDRRAPAARARRAPRPARDPRRASRARRHGRPRLPSRCERRLARRAERRNRVHGGAGRRPVGRPRPRPPAGPVPYRIRFGFPDGNTWELDDPYRFAPTLGEVDLHLIGEGTHERLYDVLGAHPRTHEGVAGVSFAVWAPNARSVRIVGDFDRWDGRLMPMRSLGASGVWELFVPGIGAGELYKFEILGADGKLRLKADPFAFAMQVRPETASRVWDPSVYPWTDDDWMRRRADARSVSVTDGGLRGPPRLVDAQRRRHVAGLPAGGRGARHALPGVRVHPRRAAAGGRAPVRRLVGLPGHRLLRADIALRIAGRLRRHGRRAAQRGDRGDRRLGARPLPDRRLRTAPIRRHGRCTSTPTHSAASIPTGAR